MLWEIWPLNQRVQLNNFAYKNQSSDRIIIAENHIQEFAIGMEEQVVYWNKVNLT